MAFWTTTPEQDPKRNFRFQVFMTGIQDSEPAVWWAKKVTKPNFTVAESKHVYLGHTFYYPGKVEWQTISMTLVDPLNQVLSIDLTRLSDKLVIEFLLMVTLWLHNLKTKLQTLWELLKFSRLMEMVTRLKLGILSILSLSL